MPMSRRAFVAGAAAAAVVRPLAGARNPPPQSGPPDRFDPWVEVDAEALRFNLGVVSRLAGGRPVLAVIKNNAYGLGLTNVPAALESSPAIAGFAVVKSEAALALKDAGVRKPVLLMGLFDDREGAELVRRGVHLALTTDDAADRLERAERAAGRRAVGHAYLDTGMSRMGIPYHRALPWMEDLARRGVQVGGTFMAFTEEADFDREQLRRFLEVADAVRTRGVAPGRLHAASSNGVYHFPEAHLDMVRPGIALFGAYPSEPNVERAKAELMPAVRLRARIVRVERLRTGDTVSYGRSYVAERPTWIATIPAGHTDGVPREAVRGQKALIGGRLYPFIGAVSASHSIVEVGEERTVQVGDVVTLVGPDAPEIEPNRIAEATGRSVYDVLMHLNPTLPRVLHGA
jgi:alanine racemase